MPEVSNPWRVTHGDCLDVMRSMSSGCVGAIVTDPPYGLGFMGKKWDSDFTPGDSPMRRTAERDAVNAGAARQGGRQRACADYGKRMARDSRAFQEWAEAWATEALRVALPGAHLVAFGGTRTFHRLTCAIEDAGWEVRDCLSWLYGSGFPKSHNGPWGGTALKPAWEPIILARKPLVGTVAANHAKHGTGALNIDGCRIAAADSYSYPNGPRGNVNPTSVHLPRREEPVESNPLGRWPANVVLDEWDDPVLRLRYNAPEPLWEFYRDRGALPCVSPPQRAQDGQPTRELGTVGQRDAQAGSHGDPAGTSGAPIGERTAPRRVVEARESEIPQGWLRYFERTGRAIRCGAAAALDEQSGTLTSGDLRGNETYAGYRPGDEAVDTSRCLMDRTGDSGGASRFFYTAKASRSEREAGLEGAAGDRITPMAGRGQPGLKCRKCERWKVSGNPCECAEPDFEPSAFVRPATRNTHPTVKPVDLMRWLVRLVAPIGSTVLDPFMGSGTTGIACVEEGCRFHGIEREREYLDIAVARLTAASAGRLW